MGSIGQSWERADQKRVIAEAGIVCAGAPLQILAVEATPAGHIQRAACPISPMK